MQIVTRLTRVTTLGDNLLWILWGKIWILLGKVLDSLGESLGFVGGRFEIYIITITSSATCLGLWFNTKYIYEI